MCPDNREQVGCKGDQAAQPERGLWVVWIVDNEIPSVGDSGDADMYPQDFGHRAASIQGSKSPNTDAG